jgi:hypothetical protein
MVQEFHTQMATIQNTNQDHQQLLDKVQFLNLVHLIQHHQHLLHLQHF